MTKHYDDLMSSIEKGKAYVGVLGLGYVGLPLIDAFSIAGFRCLGFDVDQRKIESLESQKSYIKHIADAKIARWYAESNFSATIDARELAEPDALLICVPTPLDEARDPDLSYVEAT